MNTHIPEYSNLEEECLEDEEESDWERCSFTQEDFDRVFERDDDLDDSGDSI